MNPSSAPEVAETYRVPSPPSETDRYTALKNCKQLLTIPICEHVCPSILDTYIQNCATDILATDVNGQPNYAFAKSSRQSLNTLCASLVAPSIESPPKNTTVIVQVVKFAQDAGYGNDASNCPNGCSGHGECGLSGCACLEPWTGNDCSLSQSQPMAAAVAASDAAKFAPVNYIQMNSTSAKAAIDRSPGVRQI